MTGTAPRRILALASGLTILCIGSYASPATAVPVSATIDLVDSYLYQGKLYQSYKISSGRLSWSSASTFAQGLGAALVSFNNQAENDAIFSNLGSNPVLWSPANSIANYVGPYIGLFQSAASPEPGANWRWVDGTVLTDSSGITLAYSNWLPGQPDNFIQDDVGFLSGNGTIAGTWADTRNDETNAFRANSFLVEFTAVPGPLPLFGAASAFATSRRLRRRLKR